MREVTVSQLASDVGIPVDRLLKQLSDAGVAKQNAEDVISEPEKVTLLNHLRRSHGKDEKSIGSGSDKKVTLKRRTTTELRVPGSGGGRTAARGAAARTGKTVSVEVRRKRTIVKKPAGQEAGADKAAALREMEAAQQALAEQAAQREEAAAQEEARR